MGGRGRGLYAPNLSAPLLICVSQQYKIICKKYVKVAIFRDLGTYSVLTCTCIFLVQLEMETEYFGNQFWKIKR